MRCHHTRHAVDADIHRRPVRTLFIPLQRGRRGRAVAVQARPRPAWKRSREPFLRRGSPDLQPVLHSQQSRPGLRNLEQGRQTLKDHPEAPGPQPENSGDCELAPHHARRWSCTQRCSAPAPQPASSPWSFSKCQPRAAPCWIPSNPAYGTCGVLPGWVSDSP